MPKTREPGEFARWLDAAIRVRKWKQNYVAELTGVNEVQVMRWRRGIAIPGRYYMTKLAEAFGVERSMLEQLAAVPDSRLPDSAQATKDVARFWRDRYDYLIENKIPWGMRESYLAACEALADIFSGALNTGPASPLNESPSENKPDRPTHGSDSLTHCFPAARRTYRSSTPSLVLATSS